MTEHLDYLKFRRLVGKYSGDSYVKHFTCWNQLLTLMFGQLSGRDSLRDLVTVLEGAPLEMLPSRSWKRPGFPQRLRLRQPEAGFPDLRGIRLFHDG